MATTLRITTFNVENLFNRYAFLDLPWEQRHYEQFVQAVGVVSIASRQGDLVSYATTEIQRNNTAQAIIDAAPDILAVQEIENVYTLRIFNHSFLDDYFDRAFSFDGNDPRGIDVGILVKRGRTDIEIANIRTHVEDPLKGKTVMRTFIEKVGYMVSGAVFSRDCLEIDIKVKGSSKVLTLLINHLKAQDGTAASEERRTVQAKRVVEIAKTTVDAGRLPIVMGDMNAPGNSKTLAPLLTSALFQDPFASVPAKDLWTHYYVPKKEVSRLDYILPHKSLKVTGTSIVRNGLTTKCKQYTGPRYPTIGQENTEASDHCPTSIVVQL
jgi:endonuclease/exonuclease/phosphatase family metal-dependent hydrolase